MVTRVRHFDTEREAGIAKRKYQKYKPTKNHKWTVQGNSLVRIIKVRRRRNVGSLKTVYPGRIR